ncbi:protein of unknown function [Serratia sp. Tan611]|nr:protein of unknown function [Serratia sp. Tan611]
MIHMRADLPPAQAGFPFWRPLAKSNAFGALAALLLDTLDQMVVL